MCLHSNCKASAPLHPVANRVTIKARIISYHVGAVGTKTKSASILTKCKSKPIFLEYLVAGVSVLYQYLCSAAIWGVLVGNSHTAHLAHSWTNVMAEENSLTEVSYPLCTLKAYYPINCKNAYTTYLSAGKEDSGGSNLPQNSTN